MQVQKLLTDTLPAAYAVCRLQAGEADFLLVASEVEAACFAYDLNHDLDKQVVWQGIGGTMSIVQVPGTMNFWQHRSFIQVLMLKNVKLSMVFQWKFLGYPKDC